MRLPNLPKIRNLNVRGENLDAGISSMPRDSDQQLALESRNCAITVENTVVIPLQQHQSIRRGLANNLVGELILLRCYPLLFLMTRPL